MNPAVVLWLVLIQGNTHANILAYLLVLILLGMFLYFFIALSGERGEGVIRDLRRIKAKLITPHSYPK